MAERRTQRRLTAEFTAQAVKRRRDGRRLSDMAGVARCVCVDKMALTPNP
jgi:hypothetical protein